MLPLILLALHTALAAPREPDAFAIRNVRVFDGDRVLPAATVLVRGGRIAQVSTAPVRLAGVSEIDGSGHTLLPGLIDAHIHTAGDRQALVDAARYGVTTVVEMLAAPTHLRALRQGIAGAPGLEADLFSAGGAATVPGGHGQFSDIYPALARPEEAENFVAARIAEGSQFIKIIVERGFPDRPLPTLDWPTVRAVIAAAHRHDVLAVAHATRTEDVRETVEAGIDGLAHVWMGGVDDALLKRLLERRVFVVTTLAFSEAMIDAAGSDAILKDPFLSPGLSDRARQRLVPTRAGRIGVPREHFLETVRRLHAAGVRMVAGTDAANPGTAHGASLHRELELLLRAGLTPVEALRAATSAPVAALKLPNRGRIVPDAPADLVLVNGDPTQDIVASRRIAGVWKDGTRVR
jgi:imidazolonepropionase-like amidohydrolase